MEILIFLTYNLLILFFINFDKKLSSKPLEFHRDNTNDSECPKCKE
jgi:hypothetical protein